MARFLSTLPTSGPTRRTLVLLVLAIGGVHLLMLLGATHALEWRLPPAPSSSSSSQVLPLQTRTIAAAPRPLAHRAPPARHRTPAPPNASPQPPPEAQTPDTAPVDTPVAAPTDLPADSPDTALAPASAASAASAANAPNTELAVTNPSAATAAATEPVPASAWPTLALGALPPSSLLGYALNGMDKGFHYSASGELRWQHNPQAYALTLTVKAFLLGSRDFRSLGRMDSAGLAPLKFSDTWRGERATHFDREQQRIVFSGNAPVTPLQAGAQDQVSLYMQLASAMSGGPERFPVGTRLQVQTATLRDAVPWLLVLEGQEALTLDGQSVPTTKWVCQPRSQYDSKVEIWLSPRHAWMPARIRITQVSGSFIDLNLRSFTPLPSLPLISPVGEKTTSS